MDNRPQDGRTLYRRLLTHVWPYRGVLFAGIVAMVVGGLADAALVKLMGPLVNELFVNRNKDLAVLIPLAVTSTKGWVRRLGGKRWRRLHRLIYPAAVGGVLHYLWLVKQDVRMPLWFATALVVLLAIRAWVARPRRRVSAVARAPVVPAGGDAA